MSSPACPLIFVIDDDARLRDDLVDFLQGNGYQAMGFASYEQFLPVSHLLQPVLVLLDLGLPGIDGMEACRLLHQRWPQVGVVMLTSRSGVAAHQAGLQAGADAYLPKTASLPLVEATLVSVLRRLQPAQTTQAEATPAPALPTPPAWTLDEERLQLGSPDGSTTVLTLNEFRLVQALILGQGRCVTREAMLALTGKADTPPNRRNMDAVISRIRAKVRAQARADLPVRASYANGYVFAPGRLSYFGSNRLPTVIPCA